MISNRTSTGATILGFVIVVALCGIVGWAVVRGVEQDPSVVGSFATAAAAVIAVVLGRAREKRLELQHSHRERMAPIYEELFKRVRDAADAPEDVDATTFFKQWQTKLVIYGSPAVVEAFNNWQRNFDPEAAGEDPSALLRWEQVLFAIRKDLGHSDSDLAPADLLRLYVTDIDEAVAAWKMRSRAIAMQRGEGGTSA